MNLVIADILRRWRWRYLIGWLLAVGVDLASLQATDQKFLWNTYLFAPWIGGFLVLMDLVSGTAPVLAALPVPVRKVAQGYWIAGVCVPPVALVLAEAAARAVGLVFGLSYLNGWDHLLTTMAVTFLMAGASFFATTFLPTTPPDGPSRMEAIWFQFKIALTILVWMGSMVSGIFLGELARWRGMGTEVHLWLAAVAAVLTVAGYRRAVGMLTVRVRTRPVGDTRRGERGPVVFRPEVSRVRAGLLSLFMSNVPLALEMAFFAIVFGMVFPLLRSNPVFLHFGGFFVSFLAALRYALVLRFLRVLPISTNRLAVTLFLLPMVSGISFGAILFLAGSFVMGARQWITAETLAGFGMLLSLACLTTGIAVRFGFKALMALFAVFLMSTMGFVFVAARFPVPLWVYGGAGIVLLVASYWFIRRSLGASGTYRVRVGEVGIAG